MAIYVVLSAANSPSLSAAIQTNFPNDFFKITDNQWLVSAHNMTTQEVAEKMSLASGTHGQAVVFSVVNHWGWHRKDMWEWLSAKSE